MFKCGDKVIYKSFGVCTIEQTDYVLGIDERRAATCRRVSISY